MRPLLLLLALLSISALAQPAPQDTPVAAPAPEATASALLAPDAKVAFIKNAARIEKPRADVWRWAWFAGYTALTLGQAVPIPFLTDTGLRIDFAVGAITSAVGAVLMVAMPLDICGNARDFEALADDASSLEVAQKLLKQDADDEAFNTSWLLHAGNVLLNAVGSLLLGIVWHRWESAAINFVAGAAIGEAMIFTQPTGLIRARGALDAGNWAVSPFIVPNGGGVAVGAAF